VDYSQDESYTPTNISFSAGTGHHDLIEFARLPMVNPVGLQDVDLSNVGGGPDGRSLCCWIVQMQVRENHQNGKDTHIRGIKIYALDENAQRGMGVGEEEGDDIVRMADDIDRQGAILHEDADLPALPGEADLVRKWQTPRSGGGRLGFDSDDDLAGLPDFMKDPEIR